MKTLLTKGNIAALEMTGAVDGATAPAMVDEFRARVKDGRVHLIADMSGITFMSSAGLRVILMCVKETRAVGGDFCIVSPPAKVVKLLKLAGFLNVVKSFNTVEEAAASYGGV